MPYERGAGAYWTLVAAKIDPRRTDYDIAGAATLIRAGEFPEADDFARNYIDSRPTPEEAAAFFESLTRD
jgi:hypothetical protein